MADVQRRKDVQPGLTQLPSPAATCPLQALAKEAEEAAQRKAGSSQARLDLEAQMLEKIDLQRKQQVTLPPSGCKQSDEAPWRT